MNERIYDMLNELAEQAGCSAVKDGYSEARSSIRHSAIKQYAVLGDVNSGKSTIINILAGEKKLPVSARTNEHGKVALVESVGHNCRWVELSSGSYVGDGLAEVDSPLWYMDAAIYVLSATTPFSQQDITAIRTCAAHGVPCSLVLSKLDVVDEPEKDDVIAYTRAQAERHFGSDALIVLNTRDEEAVRQAVMNEFASAEDSTDFRDYMLAVSYAKTLKEHIAVKYGAAKEKMQAASEREDQAKQAFLSEKLTWDRLQLDIEARKLKLVEAMSAEMSGLYAGCIARLTDKAMLAVSPKAWWEQSLENEFRGELAGISGWIDKMICSQTAKDRDWLVQTIGQSFGANPSINIENSETQLDSIVFGLPPEDLSASRITKTIAMTGLLVSSAALCGVLVYPAIAMHSINTLYWSIAGAAVVGTGFWTFFETKKDKDEKRQCLISEISRYVLRNRDDNIEILKKNIEYGYENMKLSVQDLQLTTAKAPANEADTRVFAQFKAISELNRKCDEIVNSLLSAAEQQ